jgi:serine/threonine-protein phosphatase PPG1
MEAKKGNLDAWIAKLKQLQKLDEDHVIQLCSTTKDLLRQEDNVVHMSTPLCVVGDIHGQWYVVFSGSSGVNAKV